MNQKITLSMVAGLLLLASSASAQETQKETNFNFEEDVVTGTLVRPDQETVTGLRRGKESSLIKIRKDFVTEMVQSVERF
ncbi:MAG: hypothetical protein HQ461_05450 [Deltaproteobacteria bacterium]|jgi:hypothetical protein|nr:hypothetical protein [Deltaproteobacteria bacterium]